MFCKFLLALSTLSSIGHSSPILGGVDVGDVHSVDNGAGNVVITGQNQFPFMAHLTIYNMHPSNVGNENEETYCGGTIISTDTILTAGHCLSESPYRAHIYVAVGMVHLAYERMTAPGYWTSNYVVNEGYAEEQDLSEYESVYSRSDIALVWLNVNLVFGPTVQKATINEVEGSLEGKLGWILGWGIDSYGNYGHMLQMASTGVISNELCKTMLPGTVILPDMFCLLSGTRTAATCDGDSGGPFVSGGIVYGVSSFGHDYEMNGKKMCNPTIPEIFTHIAMYKEWIKEKFEERKIAKMASCVKPSKE